MITQVIGDTHGKAMDASMYPDGAIQVGDFNLAGYDSWKPKDGVRIAFIDGNHDQFTSIDKSGDCPQEIQPGLFYLPRGWVCGKVMFLGGAESIDHRNRHVGHDMFLEESISQSDFGKAISYDKQVSVMITHTCPNFVGPQILHGAKETMSSEIALTRLWEKFKPALWIFGHFHKDFDKIIDDTRFVCIPTLKSREFDLPLENWPDVLSNQRELGQNHTNDVSCLH